MLDEPALPPLCQPLAPRAGRTRFLLIIADPDEEMARPLADALQQRQIDVVVITDAAEALLEAGARAPDAVLTAAHVPPMTGTVIARALYTKACIPTLVGIGAHDGDEAGPALAAGARACVPRPYRLSDILPQLQVIAPDTVTDFQAVIQVGALRLDPAAFEVHLRGQRINLPLKEFQLLHLLMKNAGRVLTRHQIHQLIWSQEEDTSNTLNVHVRRIRSRLGDDLRHPRILVSVRGLGYRLDPP